MKHHWLEESQHTKLDTLIVEAAAAEAATEKEIDQAFQEYADIGAFLDNGIKQQTEFDVESFVNATGRNLSKSEREAMTASGAQRDALDLSRHRHDSLRTFLPRSSRSRPREKTDRGNGTNVLLSKNAK